MSFTLLSVFVLFRFSSYCNIDTFGGKKVEKIRKNFIIFDMGQARTGLLVKIRQAYALTHLYYININRFGKDIVRGSGQLSFNML